MISLGALKRQMVRLSLQREFPTEPDKREALSEMLCRVASDDGYLARLVDRWCESSKWCPTEADLREIVLTPEETEAEALKRSKCKACAGTGWAPCWFLVTQEKRGESHWRSKQPITHEQYQELRPRMDGWQQEVFEAVMRCAKCEYGKRLKAAAEQHAAKEHGVR